MTDFEQTSRSRSFTKTERISQKAKHLCQFDGCDCRWTHSDTPGGGMGMCGLHYHLRYGHNETEAWKKRDAQVRADLRNHGRSPV